MPQHDPPRETLCGTEKAHSEETRLLEGDTVNGDEEDGRGKAGRPPLALKDVELDEVSRFRLFRSVIEHEDILLNTRVSWILLAQSFLMAAYITAPPGRESLQFIAAGIGLLTIVSTTPTVWAAEDNIRIQREVYFRQIRSDSLCVELHGHKMIQDDPASDQKDHILPNMTWRGGYPFTKYKGISWRLGAVQVVGWILLLLAVGLNW